MSVVVRFYSIEDNQQAKPIPSVTLEVDGEDPTHVLGTVVRRIEAVPETKRTRWIEEVVSLFIFEGATYLRPMEHHYSIDAYADVVKYSFQGIQPINR